MKRAESQRKAAKGGMRVIKLANKSVAAGDTNRPKAGRLWAQPQRFTTGIATDRQFEHPATRSTYLKQAESPQKAGKKKPAEAGPLNRSQNGSGLLSRFEIRSVSLIRPIIDSLNHITDISGSG